MVSTIDIHPSAIANIYALSIIVKCKLIKLRGSWHLAKPVRETNYDGAGRELNLDYLVNINDANYLLHPEDIQVVENFINGPRSGKKIEFNFRIITPDGAIVQFEGHGKLKRSLDSNTGAIAENLNPKNFATHLNARNDKNKLEEVIASKNLLEAVFNTSTLALHVLQSVRNQKGTIVDFDILLTNETSDKIAGRKVSGSRLLDSWPHTRHIGLFDQFVQAVETGRRIDFEHLYDGDGVKNCFKWTASRLNDGLYVTVEDITRRKEGEEILKQTADRLQSTFDGVPASIALLEVVRDHQQMPLHFVISVANRSMSEFTGIENKDLIGKRMTDLIPEAFRCQLQENFLHVFTTGEPFYLELFYPESNKWVAVSVTRQVDGNGIVVVALDITGQKKAEELRKQNHLLTELNEAKTEFFSNVSHELRTPLTLILGPINDVLKKGNEKSVDHEDLQKLNMVQRNALRLQKLVNTLLDFSRIEAGKADAIFQPTDLAEYTTLLAGNFRSVIEKAGLKLIVNCQCSELIYINHNMWEQIVLNLLSNAFKFTLEGKIEVSLRSYKRQVQLQIIDTGIGISASNLPKIFERFTRIPNARSRTYEGTGIGLALVKELVHIHGGRIKVTSKEGKGTVFVVSIPLGKEHLPAKNIYEMKEKSAENLLSSIYELESMNWLPDEGETIKESQYGIISGNNVNSNGGPIDNKPVVLLVDDNSDIRAYIKNILSTRYTVVTANNGKKALELISDGLNPDLILADLMMPELDGNSLLTEIKGNQKTALIPFIILSARASEEDRIEGLRNGADDYLVKPFSSLELVARVDCRIYLAALQNKIQQLSLRV